MAFAKEAVIRNVISKFQRTLLHTVGTKTENFNGDETITEGATANIQAGFLKRGWCWKMGLKGEQDNSDAYVLANADYTIAKNHKITVDSQKFIVKDAVIRYADATNTTKVYTFCRLKIETL